VKLYSYAKEGTQVRGVREQGAEGNILAKKGCSEKRLERSA
jgi:hypothetical protein